MATCLCFSGIATMGISSCLQAFSTKRKTSNSITPAAPIAAPSAPTSSATTATTPTSLSVESPPGQDGVEQTRRAAIIQKFCLPQGRLVPSKDYTYSDSGNGVQYGRGGREYIPPYGFDKLGVLVEHFHDNLFMDKQRGWHIAFHGTDPTLAPAIIQQGLKPRGGQLHPRHGAIYGDGIYCSPLANYACKYAGERRINEQETDVVLMVRVRPNAYSEHGNGVIWLVRDPQDIRCIAVLFRRRSP